MSDYEKIINQVVDLINESEFECKYWLQEVSVIKSKSKALDFLSENLDLPGGYIEDEKEIYWGPRNVQKNEIKNEFGTHFSSLKKYLQKYLDPQLKKTELFSAVTFIEHEWYYSVGPYGGSITMMVLQVKHKKSRKSLYFEDLNQRDNTDETFGPMW